jgi:hypothetical protein
MGPSKQDSDFSRKPWTLGELQSRFYSVEKKISFPYRESNPDSSPPPSPVPIKLSSRIKRDAETHPKRA